MYGFSKPFSGGSLPRAPDDLCAVSAQSLDVRVGTLQLAYSWGMVVVLPFWVALASGAVRAACLAWNDARNLLT